MTHWRALTVKTLGSRAGRLKVASTVIPKTKCPPEPRLTESEVLAVLVAQLTRQLARSQYNAAQSSLRHLVEHASDLHEGIVAYRDKMGHRPF